MHASDFFPLMAFLGLRFRYWIIIIIIIVVIAALAYFARGRSV